MSEEENVMDMASMYVTYSFSMVEYISVSMSQRTLISSESFIPQRAIRFALLDEMSSLFSGSWQATKSTLQETYRAIMIGFRWEYALAWDESWLRDGRSLCLIRHLASINVSSDSRSVCVPLIGTYLKRPSPLARTRAVPWYATGHFVTIM